MRRQMFVRGGILAALLGLIALLSYEYSAVVQKAEAIPAFARKYDFKCNVCHVPGFPKLNDFGNLFRDRGYQLGSDADLPEYEGILMGFWPVSFRTTVGNQISSLHTGAGQPGFQSGNSSSNAVGFTTLDILSFGTLARDVAHRIVFTGQPSSEFGFGGVTPDLESAAVKLMRLEKYVGVKSAPGDYLVNLLIGKHELDVPFSEKRSPTLNTSIVMYHYLPGAAYTSGTMIPPTLAGYGSANNFGIGNNQPGIELTGIKKTNWSKGFFRYTLDGLFTNPSTSNAAATGGCCDTGGGRNVNLYAHLTQSFGGYGIVTGHRIGVSGMYGHEPTLANALCGAACTAGNYAAFSRFGADVSTTFNGEWNLFGGWMHGNDNKNLYACATCSASTVTPLGNSAGVAQNAAWNGAFIELDYYPTLLPFFNDPDWFFSYRYDVIRNSRQGMSGFAQNFNDVDSHTFVIRKFLHQSKRTDVALHMEYNWYQVKGVALDGANLIGQTMFTGVDFAF